MRPTTLITFLTFFMEMASTSPVYNMQPAFITANIGTAGRNMRHLPCISRKNNKRGVCMFAIDCVKMNGTHLGTCIDKFYFGSCCHIDPVKDITDNTIDNMDIIPAREPPQRLSSTIKPIKTELESNKTLSTTTTTTLRTTTASYKLTTFQSVDVTVPIETTTTVKPTKVVPTTTIITKPSTSKKPITTTTTKKPTISKRKTTTTATTPKTTTTTRRKTTVVTRKPTKGTKPPVATTTTVKPTKITKPAVTTTTTKSTTTTTVKPIKIATTTTVKPTKIATTTTTVKPTKFTTTTTVKPTKAATTTTVKPTKATTTTTVKPTKVTTTTTVKPIKITKPVVVTTEKSTSSPTTPVPSTTESVIVTWTNVDVEKNISVTTGSPSNNSTSEDWHPITTPDNWVPLPNITNLTTTSTVGVVTSTESASKPSITYIPLESTTSSLNATTPSSTTTSPSVETDVRPVNMSDFTDVCGRRMYPEGRIVGGERSSFGKWPWQISLRQWRTSTYLHKCGAALLNENWAITAAHCVDNVPPSDLLLRLGEHDLSTESEPYLHQERRVQIVASHPQFDPRTFEYDLALLRFYEPVSFQPNILPVCIPQSDENFVGSTAHVTGWGRLYEDGPLPSVLQEVSVPVINNSVCESMYRSAGYIEHIPHIFICAGWRRGGFDSCEGDSGGPMVIQREDKRFLLAGVISWGIGCAEPNQPGVYTRISEFREWINQILQF